MLITAKTQRAPRTTTTLITANKDCLMPGDEPNTEIDELGRLVIGAAIEVH